MPVTPEDLSIPRASLGTSANIEEAVNPALERVAAIIAPQDQGPWSTIPAATSGRKGMRYYATDRRLEYLCTGSEWRRVSTSVRRSVIPESFGPFPVATPSSGWSWIPGDSAPLLGTPRVEVPYAGRFDVRFGVDVSPPPPFFAGPFEVGVGVMWTDTNDFAIARRFTVPVAGTLTEWIPVPLDVFRPSVQFSTAGRMIKLAVRAPQVDLEVTSAYLEISPSPEAF